LDQEPIEAVVEGPWRGENPWGVEKSPLEFAAKVVIILLLTYIIINIYYYYYY
jgi:hypothetical protein